VVEGYDSSRGKFPSTYGNTAMVDCKNLVQSIIP